SPDGLLASAASLWNFLISFPAVRDGTKLFLIGGSLESARRLLFMAWAYLIESFFITVEFEDRDDSFIWIMFWLSKQETWNKSRNIRISTSRYGQSGPADKVPGEEEDGKVSSPLRRLAYMPAHNKTQYLWYKGSLMTVTRSQTQGDMWNRTGDERVSITLFTRNFSKIDMLLLEAKRAYKKESEGRINIYVSDTQNEWTLTGSRPKRPLSSVVLEKGIKEHLLIDAKDFMASEKWYADRGIPWRRGYLLHGSPGSGKTSLIHSLAGELDLDIYVISLSKKNLDDSSLNELISKLPSRSLALMEDIDAAFFRGVTREGDFGVPLMPGQPPGTPALDLQSGSPAAQGSSASGVTLSGLLGAIDGVAAQEGRLLFATTNKYAALDPALVRPGRLDVHVRFDNAGRLQAAKLFRCFFPPEVDMEGGKHGDYDNDEDTEDEGWIGDSTLTKSPPGLPSGLVLPAAVKGSTRCPSLTRGEVGRLARAFAERVPEGEFSMAAIQGLLMQYKTRPYLVINEVEAWVAAERRKRAERDGKSV
ncbi:P-loop containing nucleoside triphosphate hydrolase protein, partial [Phellopilus nigrolimitatus]